MAHRGAELAGGLGADLAVRDGAHLGLQRLDVRGGEGAVLARTHPGLEGAGGRGAELAVHHEGAGAGGRRRGCRGRSGLCRGAAIEVLLERLDGGVVAAEVPHPVAAQADRGAELAGGLGADLPVGARTHLGLQRPDVRARERAVLAHAHPGLQGAGGGGAELAVDHEGAGAGALGVAGGGAFTACGLGVRVRATVGLGQARALAAGGPGAGALLVQGALGDGDLLGLGGLVRVARVLVPAKGLPGRRRELQAAVVAVAGVDRPVAGGLAVGNLVPHAVIGGGDAAACHAHPGRDHRTSGGGGDLRGHAHVAEVHGRAIGTMSGDTAGHRHLRLLGEVSRVDALTVPRIGRPRARESSFLPLVLANFYPERRILESHPRNY